MIGPIIRNYDKRIYKKCIKCRAWKPREDVLNDNGSDDAKVHIKHGFSKHADSSDGLQSICFTCKNAMNIVARKRNVTQRIRHHTGTRCLTQLAGHVPPKFVTNLEDYLGYKIIALVRHLSKDLREREGKKRKLRDALNESYHIDHIRPLSKFPVVGDDGVVDWDVFRDCWAITNLRAIPAEENLAKGAKIEVGSDEGEGP